MDFAKKILGKYGWKEGDGLGRNSSGIAKPLKASLKFDNAGLGVDRAKEFNDHWWERCFNEAANNVSVDVQNGQVSTARKQGQEAVEISTKSYSVKKLKKAKEQQGGSAIYDNFLQSATLTQTGDEVLQTDSIKPDDIAVTTVNVLTDEELFRACGGRTAHKGARHGLKLSGKLARLEKQEQEMLERMQATKNIVEPSVASPKADKPAKDIELECIKYQKDTVETNEVFKKSKKQRHNENNSEKEQEIDVQVEIAKKCKRKHHIKEKTPDPKKDAVLEETKSSKKLKKAKRHIEKNAEDVEESKLKKKKRKNSE